MAFSPRTAFCMSSSAQMGGCRAEQANSLRLRSQPGWRWRRGALNPNDTTSPPTSAAVGDAAQLEQGVPLLEKYYVAAPPIRRVVGAFTTAISYLKELGELPSSEDWVPDPDLVRWVGASRMIQFCVPPQRGSRRSPKSDVVSGIAI